MDGDPEFLTLEVVIKDTAALHEAYMPFLKNGGLFVATEEDIVLGQRVTLLLDLMGEPEILRISGKTVWCTPKGAEGSRQAGIGVEFPEDGIGVNSKIRDYLASTLTSQSSTHTM
jgi:type IV pilus assembly protein PilZ